MLLSVHWRLRWEDDLRALGPHKSSAADCYVVLDFCLYLEPQTEKTQLEAGCTASKENAFRKEWHLPYGCDTQGFPSRFKGQPWVSGYAELAGYPSKRRAWNEKGQVTGWKKRSSLCYSPRGGSQRGQIGLWMSLPPSQVLGDCHLQMLIIHEAGLCLVLMHSDGIL